MILKLQFYIFSIAILISCTPTNNVHKVDATKYVGWWINTTIADSTIIKKTIYGSRSYLEQDVVMIEIRNDTIYTYGSIINKMKFPINGNNDTLATIQGMAEAHIIANKKTLLAKTERRNEKYSEIFRKATVEEQTQLSRNISKTNTIAKNLEIWFAEKLLSGTYQDEKGKFINLSKNRECIGFKNYTSFETHFTSGTLDWMSNDWIKFTDSTSNESITYHFKFENNKMNLYEYLMVNVEGQWEVGQLKSSWSKTNE